MMPYPVHNAPPMPGYQIPMTPDYPPFNHLPSTSSHVVRPQIPSPIGQPLGL